QVLNIGSAGNVPENPTGYGHITPRPRPAITQGFTERVKIGCGNLYITVNYDENGICEVFTSTGKAGGCPSQSEATARLVSVALRSGMDVQEIYDQLKGIRCPSTIRQSGMSCTSCPDAIAKVVAKVAKFIEENKAGLAPAKLMPEKRTPEKAGEKQQPASLSADTMHFCPECGAKLEHEGGCVICRSCGFSKCG
ncbi:MAG: TSCPD domain-containing protein, partial [Clostridiaceae bacterium]|nr:TSCPD domain-containing protein [Clostridiaceae bacterium]